MRMMKVLTIEDRSFFSAAAVVVVVGVIKVVKILIIFCFSI